MFEADLRRQASVCAQLAEDCDYPYLAERLRLMASDLAAKADELDKFAAEPGEILPDNSGRPKLATY
jgi:hypothetical protein